MTDDLRDFVPGGEFVPGDETRQYWIGGGRVMFGTDPVRGADAETFRCFRNGFARDARRCYVVERRFDGPEPVGFRLLDYAYVTDGRGVWTLGGALPDADAARLTVCDAGFVALPGGGRVPYGYAKDHQRVYYYDFDGRPVHVRKASPATFASAHDGHFGRDDAAVFLGRAALPRATPSTWRKVGPATSLYSTDGTRIYYANRRLAAADPATFAVLDHPNQLARDARHRWFTNLLTAEPEFEAPAR